MLLQVVDPRRASYGVEHATYAVMQLAQTTMRSELGKITLDKTFEERDALNRNIVSSIQCAVLRPASSSPVIKCAQCVVLSKQHVKTRCWHCRSCFLLHAPRIQSYHDVPTSVPVMTNRLEHHAMSFIA